MFTREIKREVLDEFDLGRVKDEPVDEPEEEPQVADVTPKRKVSN